MMLERIVCGRARSNAYVYACDDGDAVVVDAGPGAARRVVDVVEAAGLRPRALLLTHGHPDHIATARRMCERYGIDAFLHPDDARWFFGRRRPGALHPLTNGVSLHLGSITVDVWHTPGHSRGSVCFVADRLAFAGDTVFRGAVGASMYPGGDRRALARSVRSLLALDDGLALHPGHGSSTTVGAERRIWEAYAAASTR